MSMSATSELVRHVRLGVSTLQSPFSIGMTWLVRRLSVTAYNQNTRQVSVLGLRSLFHEGQRIVEPLN
jgi:hypothetical protein